MTRNQHSSQSNANCSHWWHLVVLPQSTWTQACNFFWNTCGRSASPWVTLAPLSHVQKFLKLLWKVGRYKVQSSTAKSAFWTLRVWYTAILAVCSAEVRQTDVGQRQQNKRKLILAGVLPLLRGCLSFSHCSRGVRLGFHRHWGAAALRLHQLLYRMEMLLSVSTSFTMQLQRWQCTWFLLRCCLHSLLRGFYNSCGCLFLQEHYDKWWR